MTRFAGLPARLAPWGVAALGIALLSLLTFDQGHVMSLFEGGRAFEVNFIHEFVHDARHAAGLPCH
jgi:hypothetical protein